MQLANHRHNLICNAIHEAIWGFGIAFHTTYAVVPLFLKMLDAPPIIIGSVAGVFTACAAIPQIGIAFFGQRIQNLKKGVILAHAVLIPPILFIGVLFAFFTTIGTQAWVIYFICFIFFSIGVGVVFPIWADFLELSHLPERRGEFFGVSFAIFNGAGFIGGFAVKKLLDSVPFPSNFGFGFIIFSICIIISVILFFFYRLEPKEGSKYNKDFKRFKKLVAHIIKSDNNFRRYLFSRMLLSANYPAISLYAVYTYEKFHFDVSEAGIFIAISVLTSSIASLGMGKLGDKIGHKHVLVLVFIGYIGALITTLFAKTMAHTYLIFAFLGMGQGGFLTTSMSLIYEFAGNTGDKKIYFALTDSFIAPFVVLFVILSGLFIPIFGIGKVLMGLGIFIFFGLIFLAFFTVEPKLMERDKII